MVEVKFDIRFSTLFSKIKDNAQRQKIIKQIKKISNNPEIGKPMMYGRKGTRELYVKPYRLSYIFNAKEKTVLIINLYHKKNQ